MAQMGQESPPPIRHWCDQGDKIPMYGWFAHDGINFGVQEIVDHYYTVSTDFVKRPGGTHGGDWSARFRIQPRVRWSKGMSDQVTTVEVFCQCLYLNSFIRTSKLAFVTFENK